MPHKNSDHLRHREVLKGPLCQARRGKHAGQMWPSAKIQIAPLKGCLIWGLMRMNMRIISNGGSRGEWVSVVMWVHTYEDTHSIICFIRLCILSESVPMCAGKHHSCHGGRALAGFIIDSGAAAPLWWMILYRWLEALWSAEVLNHNDTFRLLLCYLNSEDKQIMTLQTACRHICMYTYNCNLYL